MTNKNKLDKKKYNVMYFEKEEPKMDGTTYFSLGQSFIIFWTHYGY